MVPDHSFSSLNVVPSFPCMLFLNLTTTSSLLSPIILCFYRVVGNVMIIIRVLGGDCSAHPCNGRRHSGLKFTRGLGEDGRTFSYNMGVTQQIEIFHPPSSRKYTQFCAFGIFSTIVIVLHSMDLLPSPHLPSFLPLAFVSPTIACTGGLLAPDVRRSTY